MIYLIGKKEGLVCIGRYMNKEGYNPKLKKTVKTERRRIKVDLNLPMKDEYGEFIKSLIEKNFI